ncbi:hypothetical protein CYMTET_49039 [Cymbomonas tetramitiformis]|uniref:Uncharacterized protein n=1 Tax=Cymbomonas tetramitiformis TaxID=36881 RepID=A0AAE0EV51_9CHLO|nr:hypothetical protein CYMTET_49039 [Cymbomonas tetramitiformis]
MLEDTDGEGSSAEDLPVYVDVLVAFLSRHRLALRAAMAILGSQPVKMLTNYLENNTTDLQRELKHFFTQRVVNKIAKKWTPTIGLAIRFRLGLSMENYDRLRQMISKTFDTESNESSTWYVLDTESSDKKVQWRVKAPKLPSNYALDRLRDEITKELNLQENEMGNAAQISFRTKLSQVITTEMETGFLRPALLTAPKGTVIKLELFISGDAHGIHRGVKVTRVTFKLKVEGGVFNNSPFRMYTVVFFRGSDNYENLIQNSTDLSRELSAIAKTPLTVGAWQFSFKLTHGGGFTIYLCQLGTLCACGKHFRNQREVDNDKLPETKSGRKNQVKQHFGHYMHCKPVFPVWECDDIFDVISGCVACLLHWLLRLIDLLFLFTVHIHADTEEKAVALSELLQKKGVSLNKKVKPYDAMKASSSRDDKTTFIGEHCASILAEYPDYLELHTPEARKDQYENMWLATYSFFELMWTPVEDTPENREAHAQEVFKMAKEMADAITDGVPAINSLYPHISLHLPVFIRRHGCNLRQYSGQGGEHLNKLGQMFARAFTNKRMKVYRDKKTDTMKRQRIKLQGRKKAHPKTLENVLVDADDGGAYGPPPTAARASVTLPELLQQLCALQPSEPPLVQRSQAHAGHDALQLVGVQCRPMQVRDCFPVVDIVLHSYAKGFTYLFFTR